MTRALSDESANWIPPSNPRMFASTVPNLEENLPYRVNREAAQNYIKNRGSLNIGDWAIEGRRMSTTTTTLPKDEGALATQPKVLGPDALRNYNRSRCTSARFIQGSSEAQDAQCGSRVSREGRANYEKNRDSELKRLLESYGKLSEPAQSAYNVQGELIRTRFCPHQEDQMGSLISEYGRASATPRRTPNVKGMDAEKNLYKGYGDSHILRHGIKSDEPTREPHLKGAQAQFNYDLGQGPNVNELFHQYGQLPLSARAGPKVKYDGVDYHRKGQGGEMQKTLSQCPLTERQPRRPSSASLWS